MEKNARVEIGKTPSVHSGRPSETEKDGEAICEDEMKKSAVYNEDGDCVGETYVVHTNHEGDSAPKNQKNK
jgi:hypothetical protein